MIFNRFVLLLLVFTTLSTSMATVYVTVGNSTTATNLSSMNLSHCTQDYQSKCYVELNDLGTRLASYDSVSITFEKSLVAFLMNNVVTFKNHNQLELCGTPFTRTTILCKSSNAGLKVTNVSNILVSNIIFKSCGFQHHHPQTDQSMVWNALVFDSCENIRLTSVNVNGSIGFGLSMFDSRGSVQFDSCLFYNNTAQLGGVDSGGGGMYLEVTSSTQSNGDISSRGVYRLSNCTFIYNIAHTMLAYPEENEVRTFGQGGGLLISLKGDASEHHFIITNCRFINNTAVWGGGLHLFITNSSSNNVIFVEHSLFSGNEASTGGGGMVVYMVSHSSCITGNNISIVSSQFVRNRATSQGGGTIISFLSYRPRNCEGGKDNYLRFEECTWSSNTASYSGAIDITTATEMRQTELFLMVPIFSNCTFTKNMVVKAPLQQSMNEFDESLVGKAALMVLGSVVKFEHYVKFCENSETALFAISSKVEFSPGTNASFLRNRGKNGGAVALISSTISLGDNARLEFISNRAYELGGAIYSEMLGEHELHKSIRIINCLLRCQNCRSITLSFKNNSANPLEGAGTYSFGKSIFAKSFASCVSTEILPSLQLTNTTTLNVTAFLDKIANFKFIGSKAYDEVVSSGFNFTLLNHSDSEIIPGREFDVLPVTKDRFGHTLKSGYKASQPACRVGSISIDEKYTHLPNNKLRLYGDPGSWCNISIEREESSFSLSFEISIVECPPGFVPKKNNEVSTLNNHSRIKCVCARQVTDDKEGKYRGIESCNDLTFEVRVLYYYWIGYESENASHKNLITSFCPFSFCSYNTLSSTYKYVLPSKANKSTLDQFFCSNGRTGKICGSCKANFSVYFHSPSFSCGENNLCSIGWLFYILSEILVLTIVFTTILCFNISFTTGLLNGFVFYAQIINIYRIFTMHYEGIYPHWAVVTTRASIFIYHFFNLDFFYLDSLSFCLWKGASTLDIIAMKYLTIVLAFSLVFAAFVFMNIQAFVKIRCCTKYLQLRQSVIHGISTFLVICFAQTVKITFYILTPGFVFRKGDKIASYQVLYDGDIPFFSTSHFKYLLPGLILFTSIVVIPTFFLMCYPLGFKALYKCGVSESKITKLHQIFCIIRLRPLFDSFQGCYKDKYRFFAGLYFIYRVSFLANYAFSFGRTQFLIQTQIQLTLMLLIHCFTHPYKQNLHNVLDTFLFTNTALINGLSILIHTKGKQRLYDVNVGVASAFQTFLIGLPLVVLLSYAILKIIMKLKAKLCRKSQPDKEIEDIPFRLLEDDEEASRDL